MLSVMLHLLFLNSGILTFLLMSIMARNNSKYYHLDELLTVPNQSLYFHDIIKLINTIFWSCFIFTSHCPWDVWLPWPGSALGHVGGFISLGTWMVTEWGYCVLIIKLIKLDLETFQHPCHIAMPDICIYILHDICTRIIPQCLHTKPWTYKALRFNDLHHKVKESNGLMLQVHIYP